MATNVRSDPVLIARVDAGAAIGSGHLVRSVALAQAWQDLGGRALMATACPAGELPASVAAAGIELLHVGQPHPAPGDLARVQALVRQHGAEWVSCDGYHFDAAYTGALRATGARVLVIDDVADAPAYRADVILNHNVFADRFAYAADAGVRRLLGTRYCLLRREFRRHGRPAPRAAVRTVLVTMGGADPGNQTLTAMQATARLRRETVAVRVLVGSANPHRAALEAAAASCPRMELVVDPADVPALLADTDLAVSAGGSTCWELSFFGIPAVLLTLTANQTGITAGLAEAGAAVHLGRAGDVGVDDIARALDGLIADETRRSSMAARARALVDGCGARRVARVLRGEGGPSDA